MLTSTDFSGLFNRRFFKNFLPIPATYYLQIGLKTPDFQLPDVTHGQSVRLSNYRGNCPVVLAFTRIFTEKQYCPLCYPHIKALNTNYEQFVQRGVEVLMITSTDEQQSQTVVKDLGLKMPLLSDPNCNTFRRYKLGQALGAPLSAQFVLDRDGILRYQHLFSFFESNAGIDKLLGELDKLTTY
ncbi:MAG: peroxiredoxin family protein [Limnoraphis robusta]|uniref:Alkyl hydroperoxide reductase n=2 Tax=Limnoraphis robusta TaxID=1118279 RepID=A0A0F5Y897_9CYAN|nr:peroxiredoxin family protein [Limnoraphis robusta]KKD34440.1 alkyl hydroperoxide reductase [Limnoraphis robusta CS-951]